METDTHASILAMKHDRESDASFWERYPSFLEGKGPYFPLQVLLYLVVMPTSPAIMLQPKDEANTGEG